MRHWVLIASYFGYWLFWLLVGWGVVQLAATFGVSWTDALAPAFLVVFFGIGSAAYLAKRRRLLAAGQPAPRYLATVVPVDPKQTVPFPRPLRMLVGAIFLLFGVLFAIGTVLLFVGFIIDRKFLAALLVGAMFGSFGMAITYVGWRLLVVRDGERLVRPIRRGQ
jgi:hypothetical protein